MEDGEKAIATNQQISRNVNIQGGINDQQQNIQELSMNQIDSLKMSVGKDRSQQIASSLEKQKIEKSNRQIFQQVNPDLCTINRSEAQKLLQQACQKEGRAVDVEQQKNQKICHVIKRRYERKKKGAQSRVSGSKTCQKKENDGNDEELIQRDTSNAIHGFSPIEDQRVSKDFLKDLQKLNMGVKKKDLYKSKVASVRQPNFMIFAPKTAVLRTRKLQNQNGRGQNEQLQQQNEEIKIIQENLIEENQSSDSIDRKQWAKELSQWMINEKKQGGALSKKGQEQNNILEPQQQQKLQIQKQKDSPFGGLQVSNDQLINQNEQQLMDKLIEKIKALKFEGNNSEFFNKIIGLEEFKHIQLQDLQRSKQFKKMLNRDGLPRRLQMNLPQSSGKVKSPTIEDESYQAFLDHIKKHGKTSVQRQHENNQIEQFRQLEQKIREPYSVNADDAHRLLKAYCESKQLKPVSQSTLQRFVADGRHWLIMVKSRSTADESLIIILRKELKLLWATFGKRQSKVNVVLSYGRLYTENEIDENGARIDKRIHVLNLCLSVRGEPNKKTTAGPGNSLMLDYSDKQNCTVKVLDLFTGDKTANQRVASVKQLMSTELIAFLEAQNLECILIGIKCISPPQDETPGNFLRFFNKSARDQLKAEILECYLSQVEMANKQKKNQRDQNQAQIDLQTSKWNGLESMQINQNTVIYAFGDDRRDPIHFSADERDMEVLCHHDEKENFIWPKDFKKPDLKNQHLQKQADLPVLTIRLYDGVDKDGCDQLQKYHVPRFMKLEKEEVNALNADQSEMYKNSSDLKQFGGIKYLEDWLKKTIEDQDVILNDIRSGKNKGLDPAPPKIEKFKFNAHDGYVAKNEFQRYYTGLIKQDFQAMVKTEGKGNIHLYVKGENSFAGIFNDLDDKAKLRVLQGLNEEGFEVLRVEYLNRFIGPYKYDITGHNDLKTRKKAITDKRTKLESLFAQQMQMGLLKFKSRREALKAANGQNQSQNAQMESGSEYIQSQKFARKTKTSTKKIQVKRRSLAKLFGPITASVEGAKSSRISNASSGKSSVGRLTSHSVRSNNTWGNSERTGNLSEKDQIQQPNNNQSPINNNGQVGAYESLYNMSPVGSDYTDQEDFFEQLVKGENNEEMQAFWNTHQKRLVKRGNLIIPESEKKKHSKQNKNLLNFESDLNEMNQDGFSQSSSSSQSSGDFGNQQFNNQQKVSQINQTALQRTNQQNKIIQKQQLLLQNLNQQKKTVPHLNQLDSGQLTELFHLSKNLQSEAKFLAPKSEEFKEFLKHSETNKLAQVYKKAKEQHRKEYDQKTKGSDMQILSSKNISNNFANQAVLTAPGNFRDTLQNQLDVFFPGQYIVEYEKQENYFDFDSLLRHKNGEIFVNFFSNHRMRITKAKKQQAIDDQDDDSQGSNKSSSEESDANYEEGATKKQIKAYEKSKKQKQKQVFLSKRSDEQRPQKNNQNDKKSSSDSHDEQNKLQLQNQKSGELQKRQKAEKGQDERQKREQKKKDEKKK